MLLCLLGLLWSQQASVTGVILNDENQTPIHGANIYLKKLGIGKAGKKVKQ